MGRMANPYCEELGKTYTPLTIEEEAARCLLCYDAPCSKGCPAGTDPARFIRSVRFKNVKGAARTIRENNALGAVCARVCPTERYCELACSRTGIDHPIDIAGIQRYVTDMEEALGLELLHAGKANGKSVAIVGSGPAGLQAAASLAELGYAVEIFEEAEKAGGVLRYGIPEYRLPNEVVDHEMARIERLGVKIHLGAKVGRDIALSELEKTHDAVLLAVGYSEPKMLSLFEGNDAAETAVSFLHRVKEAKGELDLPKSMLVIGGGDSAMDAATSAKKAGVPYVTVVCRKFLTAFRASAAELSAAQAAGVTIIDGYAPEKVDGHTVTFRHREAEATFTCTADLIVLAVGQKVDAEGLTLDLSKDAEGYATSDPKLFVTGDIVSGDKTVVASVKRAKEAASAIDAALRKEGC
ncbi:MAG: dihydropyrimidine dehydrogenase [Coriobacteriaceae bacterium]|jgi:dihydropyrimidine dehydrogenase (NAD+) subunit PreT|nr:MAG: dihydropyrimidine dehydrogenase [Coriobacteriaceae bacterium]